MKIPHPVASRHPTGGEGEPAGPDEGFTGMGPPIFSITLRGSPSVPSIMAPASPQRSLKKTIGLSIFRLKNFGKARFECPICSYQGPFQDLDLPTGFRKHAQCPDCESLERHRLQYVALQSILAPLNTAKLTMLHFAPEAFFRGFFSERFEDYQTADFEMTSVDHTVDLQKLPFPDASYDFVFASHVLEHVPDDRRAIQQIRRILRPGGIAVLPVPIVCEKTVEYSEPDPNESNHVRAPGMDYFDRYESCFARVHRIGSDSVPEKYQPFVHEDRRGLPPPKFPRHERPGERFIDIVPVCYV